MSWDESAPPTALRRPLQMTERHLIALPTAGTHPEAPSWLGRPRALASTTTPIPAAAGLLVRGRARMWMWLCVGAAAVWWVHAQS